MGLERRFRSALACLPPLLALGLGACHRTPKAAADHGAPPLPSAGAVSPALAEFGGHRITVADFEAELAGMPPRLRAEYASPEARRRLLEEMVRLELLANEAKRRGIDRSVEVRVRVDQILVEEMMNRLFVSNAKQSPVSDDEVRAYYEAHSAEFNVPEERRALTIVATNRADAEALSKRAAAHPSDEAFFQKLAQDHGGAAFDTGFFSSATTVRPSEGLRNAIFGVDPAAVARPAVVTVGDKVYVVLLAGVRPAIARKPEDVRTLIEGRLREERRARAIAEFTDGLRTRARTELHAERLPTASAPNGAATGNAPTTD